MPSYTYGGQALMEGVLMRGRDAIAVAFRHPDGQIVWATERLDAGFHAKPWSKWPFIRGLVVLYETLVVGTRWLIRSANLQASGEGLELGRWSVALMLTITAVFGIGFFFLLPLFIASVTTSSVDNGLVQHLFEGLIRVALLLGYLVLISRSPDIHRVFQYHGAEHMTIHALEAGDPLTVGEVRKYPTAHQRCGTEFLVIVVLLSILAFSLVGRQSIPVMILSRILLVPVIAAVGYELLKFGARHRKNPIVKVLLYPGLLVQMITTKPPSDDMIEVAIVSMEQALVADGEAVPDGSTPFAREPMRARPAARVRARRRDPRRPAAGVMSELDAKLAEVARRYDEVQNDLGRPEVTSDPSEIRRLGQELARLEPTVEAFRRLEAVRAELAGARELRDASDADDEMHGMAGAEIDRLDADETRLLEELKVLLLPRDPNDDRDVILEIRAGAGGEEAALFANELLRMYLRYADTHKFPAEVLSLNETGIGGIKEAIVEISGDGAYSRLKFEGGVHRVQRVPSTESSGRIHTSTATVIVMPEADEVEVAYRRGARPAHRRQALVRTGRAVRQHHRLRGPHHPPADGPRRRDPGREEPAQEQGQGDVGPALAAARPQAAGAAGEGFGHAPHDGRLRRPLREDPDLQLPGQPGHGPPDRADRPRRARRAPGPDRPAHRRAGHGRPGRPAQRGHRGR